MAENPLVSVVIPTRHRPKMIVKAVSTALGQTYKNLEVVVVVDGPDDATVAVLRELGDERVRVITLQDNVGGSEARNVGVRAAKGDWIALLDDDDEWLPDKLEKQMALADTLENKNTLISCMFVERSQEEVRTYPVRLPDTGETMDCYMCVPKGLRSGGELLQTSTLLAPRSLMLAVPFVRGLRRGQEFIWLIEATTRGGAGFRVLPEVLSFFNAEGFSDERRISSKPNWRSFYNCLQEKRPLFKPHAFAFCIATRVLTDTIKCQEPSFVKLRLGASCFSARAKTGKCLAVFLYIWFVPPVTRRQLGERFRALFKKADGYRTQSSPAS